MTTTISKATIIESVWKNFFDRVKDQVKTVSITGPTTVSIASTSYTSTFPDKLIDSKSDYPILVVETPNIIGETFTMGKDKYDGTINIEIYALQAEAADKFLSSIIDSIETFKRDLRLSGLSMVFLDSVSSDNASRDKINIHVRGAKFKFKFHYNKTVAF